METGKDYISVPFEVEAKASEEVKSQTAEMMKKLADGVKGLVWQVANDYIENHLEGDVLSNYDSHVRNEVVRCAHIWVRDKDNFWGKQIRRNLLEEHRAEILPLIQNEEIERLREEVEKEKKMAEYWRRASGL